MKTVRIHHYGHSDELRYEDIARPVAADDHLLVRIRAAGVNPVDWKIREGYMKDVATFTLPLTMGQDFSGEVEGVGSEVKAFVDGDRVFGFTRGSYTEYASVPLSTIAKIPEGIGFEFAASLPTPGSTALQIVRDFAQVKAGTKILIQGAAGAVGAFAVQIAKDLGAKVYGTALGNDIEYLRSLGVEVDDQARDFDVVIDLVGHNVQLLSIPLVKKGGILVTTLPFVDEAKIKAAGVQPKHIVMKPNAQDLEELARLAKKGILKPRVSRVFPLSEAKAAQELSQNGHTNGKVILKVA